MDDNRVDRPGGALARIKLARYCKMVHYIVVIVEMIEELALGRAIVGIGACRLGPSEFIHPANEEHRAPVGFHRL
jgi:hypothetical protein